MRNYFSQWLRSRAISSKIAEGRLNTTPYPFFIIDNLLPANSLEDARRHWPVRERFNPEVPGNFVCSLLPKSVNDLIRTSPVQGRYWRRFMKNEGRAIARGLIIQYADWIIARYGETLERVYLIPSLMEADAGFPGHNTHTHHYHDPCWVGTALLYLDDDFPPFTGTTINAVTIPIDADPIEYEAWMAAQTLFWYDKPNIYDVTTADYAANRMLSLFDSAISYHSVKPSSPAAGGKRRIFRIHLGVDSMLAQRIYGVPIDEYRSRRVVPTEDPEILGWMRRDVLELKSVYPKRGLRERTRWARHMELVL